MSTAMVTAITPRILVEECGRLGINQKELLAGADLTCESIQNDSGRIPVDKMCALWGSIIQLTKDQMFALHAAEKIPFGTYRVLDYMLAVSSSPEDALARSARSFALFNNAFTLLLRSRGERIYLELHIPGKPNDIPRPYIEYILINYLLRLRIVMQMRCSPAELHFTYNKPPDTREYDRIFGAQVRFNGAVNCMVFPRALMEARNPQADEELCELLEDYAQRKLQGAFRNSPILAEIQRALTHNLETGDFTLGFLARQLAMSGRSLQREIHANGMTFRELLNRARRDQAQALLRDQTLPIKKVAIKLNFADTSSFSRAFQRWTGKSPTQYRNHS